VSAAMEQEALLGSAIAGKTSKQVYNTNDSLELSYA